MIRAATVLWAAIVVAVGYAMFQVKYEVMQQESQLARIHRQIAENREAVRVLNAEWSFLTQPARLETLAHRYLDLAPIGTAQLGTIAAIPLRAPAAQATPPAPAAVSAPAAAQLATFTPSANP
jgi:cell division protein FtsL